jgi:hypothetical protein
LSIGFEKDLEQALPETVADPCGKIVFGTDWESLGPDIAEYTAGGFQRTKANQGVHSLEGVIKELAIVEDARHPRALQEILSEELVPHAVDEGDLCEKTVPPDVEEVSLVLGSPGQATYGVACFEDGRFYAIPGKLVGSAKASRASSNNHNGAAPSGVAAASVSSLEWQTMIHSDCPSDFSD